MWAGVFEVLCRNTHFCTAIKQTTQCILIMYFSNDARTHIFDSIHKNNSDDGATFRVLDTVRITGDGSESSVVLFRRDD